jgi:hypothetical protein
MKTVCRRTKPQVRSHGVLGSRVECAVVALEFPVARSIHKGALAHHYLSSDQSTSLGQRTAGDGKYE